MYRAVLLDLYGTVLTPPPEPQPFRQVLQQTPRESGQRAFNWALTHPVDDLCAFARRFELSVPEGLEADLTRQIDAIRCFEDALPALEQLRARGVALALVSNVASPYKRPVFELGLADYFDAMIFSCDRGVKKPQPTIYQLALKRLGAAPEQTLMVGDSERCDLLGPRPLGIATRLIDRGGEPAANRLTSLSQLPELCGCPWSA